MRKFIASLALALLVPFAHAGGSSVAIAVAYDPNVPAVHLQVPADYVAIPITIQNESKDPARRVDEVERAVQVIVEAIRLHPDLAVQPGAVSLSARQDSSTKMFVSYGTPGVSTGQLYVLGALKAKDTVFGVTKKIHQAVGAATFSEDTRVVLGSTSLGMNDPEKYRPQLLALMSKALAEVRKALGTSVVFEVDRLQNPVSVMQLNDREVVLFINYTLRAQMKAS